MTKRQERHYTREAIRGENGLDLYLDTVCP